MHYAISSPSRVTNCPGMTGTVPESQVYVPHPGQKPSQTVRCPGIGSTSLIMVKNSVNFQENYQNCLILRRIIKIVATRCRILMLKFTKFNFGWGCAPDSTGGAYSAPPDHLARFKGAYF